MIEIMKVLIIDCERNITSDRDVGNPFRRQKYESYNVTYTLKNNIAHYVGVGNLSNQFKKTKVLRGKEALYALIQAQCNA
jgi:hypothetical protein